MDCYSADSIACSPFLAADRTRRSGQGVCLGALSIANGQSAFAQVPEAGALPELHLKYLFCVWPQAAQQGQGQVGPGEGQGPQAGAGQEGSMSQEDWNGMSQEEQARYWAQWEAYYSGYQQPSQPSPGPPSYAEPYQQQHGMQQQYPGQHQWQVSFLF